MKAKDVLRLLNISRTTLYHYTKSGTIKIKNEINGRYDYDEDSVYALINKNKDRINIIYARVSTSSQKSSLDSQIEATTAFCLKNGIMINKAYKDISSGMVLDRKSFNDMFEEISTYTVDTVYITNRDRLTRLSFSTLEKIFSKYGTKIVAVLDKDINEEQELLNDIVALIHTFAMKNYSKRRKKKLELIEEDLKLEIENND